MLLNGSEEDGFARSECEEDEGTDCEEREREREQHLLVKVERM